MSRRRQKPQERASARDSEPQHLSRVGAPWREWLPRLGLGRASRPGFGLGDEPVTIPVVDQWVETIRARGSRSVICLLSREERAVYLPLVGSLVRRYCERGLEVASIPVPPNQQPALTGGEQYAIVEAFEGLPKPLVVHCSDGMGCSGAAVRHLAALLSGFETASPTEAEHGEILRLIRNSRQAYATCALARGRYGLADYGRLGHLLRRAGPRDLQKYLDEIDEVRASHQRCLPCSLKFLAFCRVYSVGRLPERHRAYRDAFQECCEGWATDRDFMAEVRAAIFRARHPTRPPPTNVRYFHAQGEDGAERAAW